MIDTMKLRASGDFILSHRRVRLLLHKHPDGDVMGSCLGLARFLRKHGVDAAVFGPFEDRPYKFDFLADFDRIEHGGEEAGNKAYSGTLYLVVDSTGLDRTGFAEGDFEHLLRIDHHIAGSSYSPHDLVDTAYAATALLIVDLLRVIDEAVIDAETATCLYTGIMTDTGGFRYSSTDAHAFRSAAFLIDRGASPSRCATLVNDRRKPLYLTMMAQALDSLSLHEDGKLALLLLKPGGLPEEAQEEFNSDDFINLPRSLDSVKVVVQMKASASGEWKVGFRGKGEVNVQSVAADLGGGGHFSASGCELKGSEEAVRAKVMDRVTRALREAEHRR